MEKANKQRRLIPAMFCIMLMLIIAMSVQIFATDVNTWAELKSAMKASETDTIKLAGNIPDGDEQLDVKGIKTLDLNGFSLTITTNTDHENCIFLTTNAELTIKDSKYTPTSTNKLEVKNNSNFDGANGGNYNAGINTTNGTLVIDSGNIEAYGGAWAAGIGGGDWTSPNGTVIINGGTVTATGGHDGAGIGGGWEGSGGEITINGGTVTATGGDGYYYYGESAGAGIGGGAEGNGGTITITGGTVNATGGDGYYYYDSYYEAIYYIAAAGAGIGGGGYGESGIIIITGGYVTATAGDESEIEEDTPTVNSVALSKEKEYEEFEPHPAAGIGYGADYYGGGWYEFGVSLSEEEEESINGITIAGGTVIAIGGVAFSEAPAITASEYKYKTNELTKDEPEGDYIKSSTAAYIYNINQKYVKIVCGGETPTPPPTLSFEYLKVILTTQEYVIRVFTETNGGEISLEGLKTDIPEDGKTTHKAHSNATFIITPDEGYKVSKIVIDGEEVDLTGKNVTKNEDNSIEYTFKDITESHKMVVWFEKIPAETP